MRLFYDRTDTQPGTADVVVHVAEDGAKEQVTGAAGVGRERTRPVAAARTLVSGARSNTNAGSRKKDTVTVWACN